MLLFHVVFILFMHGILFIYSAFFKYSIKLFIFYVHFCSKGKWIFLQSWGKVQKNLGLGFSGLPPLYLSQLIRCQSFPDSSVAFSLKWDKQILIHLLTVYNCGAFDTSLYPSLVPVSSYVEIRYYNLCKQHSLLTILC